MEEDQINEIADSISRGLRFLGNGDASTHMGAIENLSLQVKEAGNRIADSILELAQAIREMKGE